MRTCTAQARAALPRRLLPARELAPAAKGCCRSRGWPGGRFKVALLSSSPGHRFPGPRFSPCVTGETPFPGSGPCHSRMRSGAIRVEWPRRPAALKRPWCLESR